MRWELRSIISPGRRWSGVALIIAVAAVVWLVVSVQILGALHPPVSFAARDHATPAWAKVYMGTIGLTFTAAILIDLVAIVRDKEKTMAWLVLMCCIIALAMYGCASE